MFSLKVILCLTQSVIKKNQNKRFSCSDPFILVILVNMYFVALFPTGAKIPFLLLEFNV